MKYYNDDREKSQAEEGDLVSVYRIGQITFKRVFWSAAVIFLIALFANFAYSAEKDYQVPWCEANKGIWKGTPVTIRDPYTGKVEGFVDCITSTHAIEVDFDYNWKEAPTQAGWYAMNTGKTAGILLIITYNKNGVQHSGYKKLTDYINHYDLPIKVWTVQQ